MDATARQVALFSGGDSLMDGDDVRMVFQTSRDYFQPHAVDRIFAQVDKFTSYVRTDESIEIFLMEFGIFLREAEKHMYPTGGAFPGLYISFPRIRAAHLKPNAKTLLMASMAGNVEFARLSKKLRQLFRRPML